MKILQIINSLSTGGAEKLLLETLPLYNKAGIKMDLLLLWDNNELFVEELKKINCCNIFILNNSTNSKDIYKISNILKLRKYLKDYDLVHVHLFPALYFVAFANLLNFKKNKLIFTEHNTTNRRLGNKYFLGIEKFIYSKYERIICITEEIQTIYQNYLKKLKHKFIVIKNGVNLKTIDDAVILLPQNIHSSLNNNDKIIIQVSAFRKQKDQQTAIRAIYQIKEEEVKLILVGDGDLKSENEKLVKQLKLEKRVIFLGQRMDVPSLLKSSFIVLLSSNYEGLSLASIEGMASGKPFVASNVPGLKDIVQDAGILFENNNETELAEIIKHLLSDRKYYEEIAARCIIRAKQYDISKMVESHISLYLDLIQAKEV